MGRSVKQEDNFDLVCIGLYKFIGTANQQTSQNRLIVLQRQEGDNTEYRLADTTYIYPVALMPAITEIRNVANTKALKGIIRDLGTECTLVGSNLTHETILNIQGMQYQGTKGPKGQDTVFGVYGFRLPQPNTVNGRILASDANLIALGRNEIGVQNPIDAFGTSNRAWHYSNTLPLNVYDRESLPRILSISPRYIRAKDDTARIRVLGRNFDATTIITIKIRPCTANTADTIDSLILSPQDITLVNSGELTITIPASYRRREGIVEMYAANTDEVVYPGAVVKLGIRDKLPIIRQIQTYFERQFRRPDPTWGWIGATVPATETKTIDSVYTGTPGGDFKQKYFIIKGENLNGFPCFTDSKDSSKVIFDGNTIKTEVVSDTELRFGFTSPQIPDEKYLTFTPGQFKFKVIDKDSFESEEVTATVYARTPTIGNRQNLRTRYLYV